MRVSSFRRCFSTKVRNHNVLTDFEFDTTKFSNNMVKLINQKPFLKTENVQMKNNITLRNLEKKATFKKDPFSLIEEDISSINNIIFKNIIDTKYSLLKEVAEYNLKLKGKNFRS